MPAGLRQTGLDYQYEIVDMHQVDCARLLAEDSPDALVLAVLCDLYEVVKEEQTMLSEVLITELPSYGLGMERGMERGMVQGLTRGMQQGMERGEQLLLSRLLQKRFGPLPPPDSGTPGSCQHHRTGRLG